MGGKLIIKPLARLGKIVEKWSNRPASVSSHYQALNMYGVSRWHFLFSRAVASPMVGSPTAGADMKVGVSLFTTFISLPFGTD